MQLTQVTHRTDHVIPVTSSTLNRHTRTAIRIADACPDQGRSIATRITLNTASARTSHTAAYRLARDPAIPITDVQWILGHQSLSTTQIYVTPTAEDVIDDVIAHHRRQAEAPPPAPRDPAPGYRPEALDVLFGRQPW